MRSGPGSKARRWPPNNRMKTFDIPYFSVDGDGVFHGNDPTRGPWDVNACHAGPVMGLVARAAEALVPEKRMTRLSADLMRPIPLDGFRVTAEIRREGRLTGATSVKVTNRDGKDCVLASTLHIAETDLGEVPTAPFPLPDFAASVEGQFPVQETAHDLPCFSHCVEVRYPPGENPDPGPTTLWMRGPHLLAGEAPTTFQRLCPLADCGNGTSRNAEIAVMGFMNCDITIVAHRHSDAEWLGSQARSHWQPNGIALAEAEIFDDKGPVASVLQTVVLMPAKA